MAWSLYDGSLYNASRLNVHEQALGHFQGEGYVTSERVDNPQEYVVLDTLFEDLEPFTPDQAQDLFSLYSHDFNSVTTTASGQEHTGLGFQNTTEEILPSKGKSPLRHSPTEIK